MGDGQTLLQACRPQKGGSQDHAWLGQEVDLARLVVALIVPIVPKQNVVYSPLDSDTAVETDRNDGCGA